MNRYHTYVREPEGRRILERPDVSGFDAGEAAARAVRMAITECGMREPEPGEHVGVTVTRVA